MFKKNSGYFYTATREVIEQTFEDYLCAFKTDPKEALDHPEATLKTKSEIVRLVCQKKSIDDEIKNENCFYQPSQLRSSVHRSLTALMEAGEVLQIWDRYYIPNNVKAKRIALITELKEVPYSKSSIFFASPNLLLIPIQQLAKEKIGTVKGIFREFITEEHCYDVRITKNYIILMIEGKDESVASLGKQLSETVKYCYENQHPEKKTLRREIRILKYERVEETPQTDTQVKGQESECVLSLDAISREAE